MNSPKRWRIGPALCMLTKTPVLNLSNPDIKKIKKRSFNTCGLLRATSNDDLRVLMFVLICRPIAKVSITPRSSTSGGSRP